MTKAFAALTGFGVIILGLAAFLPFNGWLIFLGYNTLIISLYLADRVLSAKKDHINVIRLNEDKLYFKAVNTISFSVKNSWVRPIYIELKDDLPNWHFQVNSSRMKKKIAPGEEIIFSYDVVPKKRGAYIFKEVYVRYNGVIGLWRKDFSLELLREYKVYPNLKDLGKYRLIIQNHRLLSTGHRRIPARGVGSEFESLREYVEGDDYRRLNWMATARLNKLIVNQYEAEKNQPVYILLDTGRSMSYSIKGYKKLDYAINAALILSDIVNQKGDNSGLIVFNTETSSMIAPGKGGSHRNELMEALYHVEDSNMTSDYKGAFYHLLSNQKRRSIVFIFTDFETIEEAKQLIEAVPVLKRRHVPVIVTMVNESLEKITEANSKDLRGIFNEAMSENLLSERRAIIRSLNMNGVICLETYAEDFAIDTVNEYLALKERFLG